LGYFVISRRGFRRKLLSFFSLLTRNPRRIPPFSWRKHHALPPGSVTSTAIVQQYNARIKLFRHNLQTHIFPRCKKMEGGGSVEEEEEEEEEK
jgi:hypothetical protein